MFAKNLEYYRLKYGLSKKELAQKAGVSSAMITYYESNQKKPGVQTAKKLADCLGVKLQNLMQVQNDNIEIAFRDLGELSSLPKSTRSLVQKSAERYLSKLFFISDLLGPEALPDWPEPASLVLNNDKGNGNDIERSASKLRQKLGFPAAGSIPNLIGHLEDHGILVCLLDIEDERFTGINGTADKRPFITVNRNMSAERIRAVIARELVHMFFKWPQEMEQKEAKAAAAAIADAFLMPAADLIRELGIRRSKVTNDFLITARKYGISGWLLIQKAGLAGIISKKK